MAFFGDDTLEQVRSANDIVEVIGGYFPLRRAGANFVALCPFHREKSPSFNVHPARQIFHCFGCGAGGDVFKFVQLYEKLTFPESVRRLAERARITIEADRPGEGDERGRREALFKLHEAVCKRWQQCLAGEAAGEAARQYLIHRGVPREAVEDFRIGAAPLAWDDTVNWTRSHGFDLGLAEQAGLVIARDGGGHYDRFRGRLMFPICDEQGRVVAFSGRILEAQEKAPKYVNSPETPLFSKGKVLFALDKARRAILDAGRAVVCEGQLDTIACHMAGVRHAVAPQGTALTEDHARILRRYAPEVVLCFDGDNAGANAAVKALDHLLASNLAIRVASIPPPDDPDSFIKSRGPDAFRAVLDRAEGFFEFHLRRLCEEHDAGSDRGRLLITQAFGQAALKTGNEVTIDTCAQKLSQRLGVRVEAVRAEFRKLRGNPRPAPPPGQAARPEVPPPPRPPERELWLLKLLLLHPALGPRAAVQLEPDWITHDTVRRIIAEWLGHGGEVAGLAARFADDDVARSLVTEAAAERREVPNPERQLSDLILHLRNAALDRQIVALSARLTDASLSSEERIAAIQEQQTLRGLRRQPLPEPPVEEPAEGGG